MKLQLYLDGKLFNEMSLDENEFLPIEYLSEKENIDYRKQQMDYYTEELKSIFYKQIAKTDTYEIYLAVESKMNELIED